MIPIPYLNSTEEEGVYRIIVGTDELIYSVDEQDCSISKEEIAYKNDSQNISWVKGFSLAFIFNSKDAYYFVGESNRLKNITKKDHGPYNWNLIYIPATELED